MTRAAPFFAGDAKGRSRGSGPSEGANQDLRAVRKTPSRATMWFGLEPGCTVWRSLRADEISCNLRPKPRSSLATVAPLFSG